MPWEDDYGHRPLFYRMPVMPSVKLPKLSVMVADLKDTNTRVRRKGLENFIEHLKRRPPNTHKWMENALRPLRDYATSMTYKDAVETYGFIQRIGDLRRADKFESQLTDVQRKGLDDLVWDVADRPNTSQSMINQVKTEMFTIVSHDISHHIPEKLQVATIKKLGNPDDYFKTRRVFRQYVPKD
jgi:hypothetical protein